MLLYLFITCLSFLFFWKDLSFLTLSNFAKQGISILFRPRILSRMSLVRKTLSLSSSKVENECILEKLPPDPLFRMTGVCSSLREICRSNYLWEKHMKEWRWHIASRTDLIDLKQGKQKGLMRILSLGYKQMSCLPVDSIMSWYLAFETGRFWFPAQVFNRENGQVGFMLSCYDAKLSYDPRTDTFQARYPPHGRRAVAIKDCVPWERLRVPPVDSSAHDLHVSDCLNELRPGDHIEIQWRRNKEFPYGWWYGVVGHLELCDGNENYCLCHNSDTLVQEFNQYTHDHREEGNEVDGFYEGIRKLRTKQEISMWKLLWPTQVLE
ncbi:F-box protein [Pyrus ussuriensis x Pyrus communis]|uniref:F-box protein n=1 Tax=Pyrus ussuriensis x Pyrus communis TaxID=2448454 RepID=A0A5N5GN18_9ROSA|nr:F-box protein [Pyrus ussuriensis x Pyrus communis]